MENDFDGDLVEIDQDVEKEDIEEKNEEHDEEFDDPMNVGMKTTN